LGEHIDAKPGPTPQRVNHGLGFAFPRTVTAPVAANIDARLRRSRRYSARVAWRSS
jgi:hypothetical protein